MSRIIIPKEKQSSWFDYNILKIAVFATTDLSQMGNRLVQTTTLPVPSPRAGTCLFSPVSAGQASSSGNALGDVKPNSELVKY